MRELKLDFSLVVLGKGPPAFDHPILSSPIILHQPPTTPTTNRRCNTPLDRPSESQYTGTSIGITLQTGRNVTVTAQRKAIEGIESSHPARSAFANQGA